MNAYYHELKDGREKQLTRDFVSIHQAELRRILNLEFGDRVVVELQKKRYGREGDVDIAVCKCPGTPVETLIAIEVKCLFLDEAGTFHSKKANKHHKQIRQLEKEGWDYIWFFDFIVTKPADGWFHPQAFEGYDGYDKTVESIPCGHAIFQINGIAGRPESMAGSISHKVEKVPQPIDRNAGRENIRKAFSTFDFSRTHVLVDTSQSLACRND